MGLLWLDYEEEFKTLVETAYKRERTLHPDYYAALSPRVCQIIHRDTRYNVDYLYTASLLDDDRIMEDYALWLYQLMVGVFQNRQTPEQTAEYVAEHFEVIRQCVPEVVSPDKQARLDALLLRAEDIVRHAPQAAPAQPRNCRYEAEIKQYMDSLFQKNPRRTVALIQQWSSQGVPISDIYVDILAESMRRIGELWHTAQITVDAEHYCTSVTQMAMAQMYPMLFASERKDRTLLCACPGAELHEMGARMVADLFENDGWDSIYLGAAVPEDAMLAAVRENKPDLVALSVTMPQHLIACRSLVQALKREFPTLKVAVGGKAFESTHEMWSQWPVDLYTKDARQLLAQANTLCGATA